MSDSASGRRLINPTPPVIASYLTLAILVATDIAIWSGDVMFGLVIFTSMRAKSGAGYTVYLTDECCPSLGC